MVDMPEEWKGGIDTAQFGLLLPNTEHGAFTHYGYLVKSGDEWQKVTRASLCEKNTGCCPFLRRKSCGM